MVWFSSSLPLPATHTTQIYAHALSENDFTNQEKKSHHMAVQPHLVRNVVRKLKETGNFVLRSPVKA